MRFPTYLGMSLKRTGKENGVLYSVKYVFTLTKCTGIHVRYMYIKRKAKKWTNTTNLTKLFVQNYSN